MPYGRHFLICRSAFITVVFEFQWKPAAEPAEVSEQALETVHDAGKYLSHIWRPSQQFSEVASRVTVVSYAPINMPYGESDLEPDVDDDEQGESPHADSTLGEYHRSTHFGVDRH